MENWFEQKTYLGPTMPKYDSAVIPVNIKIYLK